MTDELREKIESLRAITPRLNKAIDAAAATIKTANDFLAEVGIGVSGESSCYTSEPHPNPPDHRVWQVDSHLAYGRYGSDGKFCIHIVCLDQASDDGDNWEILGRQSWAWGSLSREEKLKSFAMLPSLLDNIVANALRITEEAEKAEATIRKTMDALS
jgi:hypothetical protein